MLDLVTRESTDEGALWRVTFGGRHPGNLLDMATMSALGDAFDAVRHDTRVRAVILTGAGGHFSYGASVQEHLPGEVAAMLAGIRRLIVRMVECDVAIIAAVRGQCLGGGLEVASVCHRIVAHADARFGQPEIALGIFAPVASVTLVERIGRPAAEDLCLTGRPIDAAEALRLRVADEVTTGDPVEAATAWARTHLVPRSASSLRHAVRAIRRGMRERLHEDLQAIEDTYLRDLAPTQDAQEGLRAFLEKRAPRWTHQ